MPSAHVGTDKLYDDCADFPQIKGPDDRESSGPSHVTGSAQSGRLQFGVKIRGPAEGRRAIFEGGAELLVGCGRHREFQRATRSKLRMADPALAPWLAVPAH